MTLVHLVALDAFLAEPYARDGCVARLVDELQRELRVALIDSEGNPTPGAERLAAEGRLALAAVDAFYAVAEELSEDAERAVVLSLFRAPASAGTPR